VVGHNPFPRKGIQDFAMAPVTGQAGEACLRTAGENVVLFRESATVSSK